MNNISNNSYIIKQIQKDIWNSGHSYIPQAKQFRISSIAYCPRKLQLEKMYPDLKIPFSDRQLGIFAIGNAGHEYIQSKLSKSAIVANEKRVTYEYENIELVGHIDILAITPDLGMKVIDIKTKDSETWWTLEKYGASEHHITQANTYSSIAKLDPYSILYVNKNDFEMLEFDFTRSETLFSAILEKANMIFLAIQDEFLLHRLAEFPDNWECQYFDKRTKKQVYCAFFQICEQANSFEEIEKLDVE